MDEKVTSLSVHTHQRLLIPGASLLILLTTLIAVLVFHQTVQLFHQRQHLQAEMLAQNTASAIRNTITDHQRILKAFAQDHLQALEKLVSNPDDETLNQRLHRLLESYMPGLFGLSIVDGRSGEFIIQEDLFSGQIDRVCIEDTHNLIIHGRHPIRVHPNPFRYHYDLVIPFDLHQKERYYLFASYSLEPFIKLLRQHQLPGHTLYVALKTPRGWLIELTAEGSRKKLYEAGEDVFLRPDAQQHLIIAPVPKTEWVVIDRPDPAVMARFKRKSAVHILAFWAFTVLAIMLFTLSLRRRMAQLLRQQAHLNAVLHELEEKNAQLARQAHTDGLTGLANRRAFDEALQREWYRNARNRSPLSLIMLDIDHFKLWNDSLGHLKGDEILRRLAATLRQQVRRHSDLIARYGGEELAILLPETDHDAACKLAERIRAAVEALQIRNRVIPRGQLTVSIGVCTCIPDPDLPADPTLIACADEALYRAKTNGRNRVECNHTSRCRAVNTAEKLTAS